jgi:hypothetical protein
MIIHDAVLIHCKKKNLRAMINDIKEIKKVMSDAAEKVIGAPIGVDVELIGESYVQKKEDKKRWEQLYEKLIKAKSGRIASTKGKVD